MRISDWGSDVCSSDLKKKKSAPQNPQRRARASKADVFANRWQKYRHRGSGSRATPAPDARCSDSVRYPIRHASIRSEEHTSELQLLMRISYAVFCLKKKKNKNPSNKQPTPHKHRNSTEITRYT